MIVDMEKKLSRLDSIENFKKKMRFETMAALKLDPQVQYNDDKKNELFFAFNRKITSARHIRAADGHACKFH